MLADEPHVVAAREMLLKLREDERLVVFWREAEEKARAEEVIKVRLPPFPRSSHALVLASIYFSTNDFFFAAF